MHSDESRTGGSLKAMVDAYERQLIQSALAAADGNQRRAAAMLGVLPTTLHEKLKRLGLLRRASAGPPPEAAQALTAAAEL